MQAPAPRTQRFYFLVKLLKFQCQSLASPNISHASVYTAYVTTYDDIQQPYIEIFDNNKINNHNNDDNK